MKIAFVLGYFPSITLTFIHNQITGLIDLGHDVHIFALKSEGTGLSHDTGEKYRLLEKTTYFSIPGNKILRIIKASYLFLRHLFKDPLKIFKSLNFIKFGKESLRLNTFYYTIPFLKTNFDIIHCHFGPNGLIGSFLKEIGIPGKLVTTFYGYDLTSHILRHGGNVYRSLFAHSDLLLPICDYFKKKLVALGADPEKIKKHPLGIDTGKFAGLTGREERPDVPVLLIVGRLVEKKGHESLLRALEIVKDQHIAFRCDIVGGGILLDDLRSLGKRLNISDYVRFLGPAKQEEVIAYLKSSHIFILPSVTAADGDQEGTPTVLLEAQAMGLPVISTFHSGIPEIVVDGETGFLISENDVNGLAEKIIYLIENPQAGKRLGEKGKTYVEENFAVDKLNLKLVEMYTESIEKPLDMLEK